MANVRISNEPEVERPHEGEITRREAIAGGAALIAAASVGTQVMAATGARTPLAQAAQEIAARARNKPGYGPLVTKSAGMKLPEGFHAVKFGAAGERMSDGLKTPRNPDGTGVFRVGNGRVRLLINRENAGIGRSLAGKNSYDPTAKGGVTSTIFDTRSGKVVESGLVLNGTDNNCNGGATPWGSWLSCEESTVGKRKGFKREHGYVFEVPAKANGPIDPVPIKDMGRFEHEACAIDPRSGIVYMTEDNGEPGDGFYRYLPNDTRRLHKGGRLQMLAVEGRSKYNTVHGQKVGKKLKCEWVDIWDPDPDDAEHHPEAVYLQGRALGAARFKGLEGCHFGRGSVYLVASEAGNARRGQIWRYTPKKNIDHGVLELLFESHDRKVLDEPDSLTVSPRGGVVVCEDGDGEDLDGGTNYIRCLNPDGKLTTFAKNVTPLDLHHYEGEDKGTFGVSEYTGASYSPDGKWLFVHIQIPGQSFAITGPWQKGWM